MSGEKMVLVKGCPWTLVFLMSMKRESREGVEVEYLREYVGSL